MKRTAWAGAAAASVALGVVWPACSSKEPAHPPALGDCIPTADASCGDPSGAGGSGVVPRGDAGQEADTSGPVTDGASCGSAATLISTANVNCLPCIEGRSDASGCCLVDEACSIDSGCVALLACALGCSGDPTCLGDCENKWPASVTTYNDLAMCIANSCTPECPALPQTVVSDR